MIKKMNQKEFLNVLQEKTSMSKENCIIVNDILENHFIIGRKNKKKIINDLMQRLNIDELKSEEIYNISMEFILTSFK